MCRFRKATSRDQGHLSGLRVYQDLQDSAHHAPTFGHPPKSPMFPPSRNSNRKSPSVAALLPPAHRSHDASAIRPASPLNTPSGPAQSRSFSELHSEASHLDRTQPP